MSMIFIDRRKAGRGKSTPNRQRVIRRVKDFVKRSKPTNIGSGSVNQSSNTANNPVTVAASALEEPVFVYEPKSGNTTWIVNGNDRFDRGDEIPLDEGDGPGGTGAGQGPNGEDEFVINVASDEFLDMFFEDCELPNLTHEKVTEKMDNKQSHAGFAPQGNPAQMSVIRTYKQAIGRRKALGSPYRKELEELKEEYKNLLENLLDDSTDDAAVVQARMTQIEERIIVLERKLAAVSAFDKVDLRFHKHEHKPLHTVEAVLVMVMDISGSMDQEKKTVARRWFALLYAFIKRRYATCDLVFIAHTTDAFEMSQNDFFSTRINGGTMVSPALDLINKIINERYDSEQTNIYVSHASDGDNWESDLGVVEEQMQRLIPKIQHFSYVEVPGSWSSDSDTNLWTTYEDIDVPLKKMSMAVIEDAEEVYDIFKSIFGKR